jgi:hypothetical protein
MSSDSGSAHRAKSAARALNAESSEPQSMPISTKEKPRGVRQKDGRGGAGRGSTTSTALEGKGKGDLERRLKRRLCDGGAGPQRRKRSMMLIFQGLLWLVGGASRQGAGREKGVPSFPFALHMSWLLRQVLLIC